MIYFNKLFKLPGPKDLGMSDDNYAMPSRLFPNNKTEKTWEDFYEILRKNYPVRYLIAYTLPTFFRDRWWSISRPFKNAHYWFVSHFVPSRRYHMLDLRQPKNGDNVDNYSYGWRDTDSRMVFALFNLLCQFVEEEVSEGYYVPTEGDIAKDPALKYQLDNYIEFMTIYIWWKKDRIIEDEEYCIKLTSWSNARCRFADNERVLWEELNTIEARKKDKLD